MNKDFILEIEENKFKVQKFGNDIELPNLVDILNALVDDIKNVDRNNVAYVIDKILELNFNEQVYVYTYIIFDDIRTIHDNKYEIKNVDRSYIYFNGKIIDFKFFDNNEILHLKKIIINNKFSNHKEITRKISEGLPMKEKMFDIEVEIYDLSEHSPEVIKHKKFVEKIGGIDIEKHITNKEIDSIVKNILCFNTDEQVDILIYILDEYYVLSEDSEKAKISERILSDERFNYLRNTIMKKINEEDE